MKVEESFHEFVQDIYLTTIDVTPLPNEFDYSYALKNYIWTTLLMTSKTLGHRASRLDPINNFFEMLMNRLIMSIITYVIMPVCTLMLPQKYSAETLSIQMRRIILFVLAFVFGLLTEHIFFYFVVESRPAPFYFFPFLVGCTFYFYGPLTGHDRHLLIGSVIGTSVVIGIVVASASEELTPDIFFGLLLTACSATFNLQQMIGDLKKNGSDEQSMVKGHFRALVVAVFSHAVITLFTGSYTPKN